MNEMHIGTPNNDCACCRQPFSALLAPVGNVRVAPAFTLLNISFEYRLCQDCVTEMKAGGERAKNAAMKINAYHMGSE